MKYKRPSDGDPNPYSFPMGMPDYLTNVELSDDDVAFLRGFDHTLIGNRVMNLLSELKTQLDEGAWMQGEDLQNLLAQVDQILSATVDDDQEE